MAEKGVVRISLRLNMKDEKHSRVYRVLSSLNKDIHKSENQFIINAVDFYISSFDSSEIIKQEGKNGKPEYLTVKDLKKIQQEMERSLKDELIRLLGMAAAGSAAVWQNSLAGTGHEKEMMEEVNPFAEEAAERWG